MMNMFSFLSSLLVLLFGTSRAFQQPAVPTTTSSSSSSLTQFFLYGQGTLLSSQEAQLPQPTQSYLDKQEWQTRQEEAVLPSERMRQEHMQDSQSSGLSDVTTAKPFQPVSSSSNNDYKYNNNDNNRNDDYRVDDKDEYRVDDDESDYDYEENEYNEDHDCREQEEPAYEESYANDDNGGFVDPFRATRPTSYYQSNNNNQHARFAQGGLDDAFGRFTGIGDPFRRSQSYLNDPLRNKVLTATTSDMRMPPPGGLALGAPPPMMPPPPQPPQPNYYYGSSYYYGAPRPRTNGPPPNSDPYRNPYDANMNPQGRSVMLQGQSRMSWTIQGQPNDYNNNNRNNRRPPPNDEWNTRPPPLNNDRNTRPPSSSSSRPSLSQEEQARNDHNRRNPQVGGRPPRGERRSGEYSSTMPPPPNRQGYSRQQGQGQMVARPNVWSQDLGRTTRRPQGRNREVLQDDPGRNGWSQPAYQLGRRVQGGASEYFRVEPNVRTVQLNLSSDGYPIMALVELILPDGSVRKIAQVYVDNGSMRPYTTTIDTPLAQDCTIRVENTGPLEYPLLARVGPAPYD